MIKILKFSAPWCGPCKVLEKNLKEAGVSYIDINVDEDDSEKLIKEYGIKSTPTLIKIKNNITIDRYNGVLSVEQLKKWCK